MANIQKDLEELIDLAFYSEATGRLWKSVQEALEHQLNIGWTLGHDPNPWFSNAHYLDRYKDVAASGVAPLLHFAEHGHKEGRDPSEVFSTTRYRQQAMPPDDTGNPLLNFMRRQSEATITVGMPVAPSPASAGKVAGPMPGNKRQPIQGIALPALSKTQIDVVIAEIDSSWYAKLHDLPDAGAAAEHYIRVGRYSRCAPHRDFDPVAYLLNNADLFEAGIDPFVHYLLHGRTEYRKAPAAKPATERLRLLLSSDGEARVMSAFGFDLDWYLGIHPELKVPGLDPVSHYKLYGEQEGRQPNVYFDPKFYGTLTQSSRQGWSSSLVEHFLAVGCWEGLAPSAWVQSAMTRGRYASAIEWLLDYLGERSAILRPAKAHKLRPMGTAELAALDPAKINRRYENRAGNYRRVVNWVIPPFSKGAGGHTTIFRCARTLARLGWHQVFWLYDQTDPTEATRMRQMYISYFPSTQADFHIVDNRFYALEDEFVVATAWQSVQHVNAVREGNACFYFVQDYEPLFLPAGENALKAQWSYALGLDVICAGDWLLQAVGSLAPRSMAFQLAADKRFSVHERSWNARRHDLCLYLRGHTERRCSDLLTQMVVRLSAMADLDICVFGDEHHSEALPPTVRQMGIITPTQMAELFANTKIGVAASATNYSIVPVEMAAAGMLVLEPSSSSTLLTTQAHGVRPVAPDATVIAHTIHKLLTTLDDSDFDEFTAASRAWAQALDWEDQFEKVADFLDSYILPDSSYTAAPQLQTIQTATIAIPTYYPGEQLRTLVQAIQAQHHSLRQVEVLVVDSVKQGRVDEVMNTLQWTTGLRRHEIDAADFRHGATRNLAASLCASDAVIFITQDALPDDDYWLESLLAPLHVYPNAALAYGRHAAYVEHNPLYGIELTQMFDGIVDRGIVAQVLPSDTRYATDHYYRAGLCFNSDNNAAYRGSLLRRLKFPNVDFGEDQAYAAMVLGAGYATVFASTAVVRHSHDYTSDHAGARARGREEGAALFQNFGLIRFLREEEYASDKVHASRWATQNGIRHGLPKEAVSAFLRAKFEYIFGVWQYCESKLSTE